MTGMGEQTVFVVDDDAGVRDSIAELVESVGLRAEGYASGQEFLERRWLQRRGCLVLDVRMPDMSGLVLQRLLKEQGFNLPIIILTGHGDVPIAVEAMKAGAFEFLQKPCRDQALLDSIIAALSHDIATHNANLANVDLARRVSTLTSREVEVLNLVLGGKTSKHIAQALDMSPRTAETHRHNILQKLGIATLKQLLLRMPSSSRD